MKISIDLSGEQLKELTKATGSKTNAEAVKKAITQFILLDKRKKLINLKGKINLDIDLDALRGRN